MILATSYERLRRYLSDDRDEALTEDQDLKRELINWMTSITRSFEKYLNREFILQSRTEYFDVKFKKQRYYPRSAPISSITNIYYSRDGVYDGSSETELDGDDDFIIGAESNSVWLNSALGFINPKGLRIIYMGGLATHGTQSTFTVTNGGNFTAGRFVLGSTSGAMGIVVSGSGTSLVLDNLRGIFEAEAINEYATEAASGSTTANDTISAIASQSLAEAYPDITMAAEMQIRYMFKHKDDFEMVGSTRDAVNLRNTYEKPQMRFTAEVINMLAPYRRAHGR
jgi:hypothetical protein